MPSLKPIDAAGALGLRYRHGWSPRHIHGITHWFRADRGVVLAGSNVSTWRNLTGNGLDATQASGSAQPLLVTGAMNGRPVVRFDGSLTFLSIAASTTPAPRTYAFAFKSTRNAANRIFDHQGSTQPIFGFYFDGTRHLFMSGATNYRYFSTSTKPSDGLTHSCIITIPGTGQNDISSASLEIDGTALTPSTTVTSGAAVASSGSILLGGSANRFLGDLGEFVVYNRALSSLERARLTTYLRIRYGVT